VFSSTSTTAHAWTPVCRREDLSPGWGEAALVGSTQVALFLVREPSGERVHAVSNIDPATGAAVLSRGIVGSRQGRPTIASPLHKDVFDLVTGECCTTPGLHLPVWQVRETDGVVAVAPLALAADAAVAG
jgi:NAD(P)H-dependent nitrite reductase small subunit